MLPLSGVLNKSAAGYQLSQEEGKITQLLFMDGLRLYGRNEMEINSLVHTVRVFSSDIGMDFGVKKCAMMVMKRGKLDKSEGIRLRMEELSEVLEMMFKVMDMWGCSRPVTLCMTK